MAKPVHLFASAPTGYVTWAKRRSSAVAINRHSSPAPAGSPLNERVIAMNYTSMMNDSNGWMTGWGGPAMWVWMTIGVLVAVLLIVAMLKISKK
jgi:hypothetical protein